MGDTGIGLLERCVVLRERCGGDERVVVLERGAAGLLVYYGTRGELTSEAFGSAWRVSCVRLGEEREAVLVCALHGESSAGLADAIRSYFSQSDRSSRICSTSWMARAFPMPTRARMRAESCAGRRRVQSLRSPRYQKRPEPVGPGLVHLMVRHIGFEPMTF